MQSNASVARTWRSRSVLSASSWLMRASMSDLPCSVCSALRMPNAIALSYSVCGYGGRSDRQRQRAGWKAGELQRRVVLRRRWQSYRYTYSA